MSARSDETRRRREAIAERIQRTGSAFTADICREFGVSEVTARADLAALEQKGALRRIRGGAISPPKTVAISYPAEREEEHLEAKRAIGRAGARLVHDGDVALLDTGTTTLQLARELRDKVGTVIVTADVAIASYASLNLPHVSTVLLPGRLWPGRLCLTGPAVRERLADIYADIAFLHADLIDGEGGCWTGLEPDARTKRLLMDHAPQRFLLADASKFHDGPVGGGLHRFASLEEFDALICEREPWTGRGSVPDAATRTVTMVAPAR